MQYSTVMSPWTGRARVRWPGIPTLPPGVERYRVAGGGTLVFHVEDGDRINLVDVEGQQAGEIVAFVDGRADPGVLDAAPTGTADGLKALLARRDASAAEMRRQLERRGLSLGDARSVDVFGPESRPGEQTTLTANASAIVVVAAPGGPMAVDQQDPPTDLTVFVHRAAPGTNVAGVNTLPEPLADPREDVRVDSATARAYEVRAGDFIQIIDVDGRQCSDFQAFDKAKLERGIERCVDVTTTRALMGSGYPAPGNHAKYYDQDFQPLVELVQDYASRHDAFSLACNPKYYEDMGYFGHANCTDNFNGELTPYDVAPRRGWMSMNFFFNTGIDETNQLTLDEPWSRPGDFVLMRALTDLVCVSSACPDDIDPANGWNPTDIHVRTYDPNLDAKRVIAFRKRTDAEAEMTKETGFHPRTSALTRNLTPYQGYWLPANYTNYGAQAEYWACREKAAMIDMSPLRKFEVLGPDAENILQYCLTKDVRRLATGQICYTAMCYDTGTMVDDGTVFRLGPDNFRWICGSDYGGERVREQAEALGLRVNVKSSTDQLHNVSVQGPNSRAILQEIVWTPPTQPRVDELKWFRFTIGRLHHHDGTPVIVSRTGFTGELGFEVFCHPNDAIELWDEIMTAGAPHGLVPMGLDALDMLRQEAGLIFAGQEFDDQTDPYEAGIGFAVPLQKKTEDFIGRSALESRKANPQRTLVGLELEGSEEAGHGDCVHVGRQQVGVVTSGMRSPVLRKTIALCRIAVQYAEPGTDVEVGKLDGHQKRLPARVVKYPFYKIEKPAP
jgi:aminomethyltransferase